ncbi:MAG: hypothetical protein U0Y68_07200 [Blastocatellia bacterium]
MSIATESPPPSPHGLRHRESVPLRRKFQVLPTSKYWRLPLAYLTA